MLFLKKGDIFCVSHTSLLFIMLSNTNRKLLGFTFYRIGYWKISILLYYLQTNEKVKKKYYMFFRGYVCFEQARLNLLAFVESIIAVLIFLETLEDRRVHTLTQFAYH